MIQKKAIRIVKRIQDCGVKGCLCTCATYFVVFNDPTKPGASITSNGSMKWPTRTALACSPEHAMVKLQEFLKEEGEL